MKGKYNMKQCKRCQSFALNISPESGYCDVCYYKHKLFSLLAVIHRDGGHYIEKHGLDESVDDAIDIIYDIYSIIEKNLEYPPK